MKELRLEARLRNNILWHAIFDNHKTVAEFAEKHRLNHSRVGDLLNLKASPLSKKTGGYLDICKRIAEICGMLPEDLFPLDLYQMKKTKIVREVTVRQLSSGIRNVLEIPAETTPFDDVSNNQRCDMTDKVLTTLTPREEDVIRRRFGLPPYDHEWTLDEIAKDEQFLIGIERVRQIEVVALRKLRHPSRADRLKDFASK